MMGILDEIYSLYGQDEGGAEKSKSAEKYTDKTDKTPSIGFVSTLTKPPYTDKTPPSGGFVSFVSAQSGDFVKKTGATELTAEEEKEAFEERAGILEFDAGLSREDAEAMAARQQETARCWRVVFADGELTVTVSPEATRAEILKLYPDAVAVDPFTRPVRKPDAPLTAEEEAAIRAWLVLIGEDDPASIACTIEDCQRDEGVRKYLLGRAAVELPKPATEEKEP
ncbi:MAG: hypothetical protein LBB76_08905 [Azoarcus sp.]|jgi:hypothetical protein|nr:hypothetical protein [Azoarcus sp.]